MTEKSISFLVTLTNVNAMQKQASKQKAVYDIANSVMNKQAAPDWLKGVGDTAKGYADKAVNATKDVAQKAYNKVKDYAPAVADKAKQYGKTVADQYNASPTATIGAGLGAGALAYGGLSLIPGLENRRGLKLLLSMLAGGAALPYADQIAQQAGSGYEAAKSVGKGVKDRASKAVGAAKERVAKAKTQEADKSQKSEKSES